MLEPNFVAATMLRNANKFAEAYYRALQPLCLETGLPPLAVDILLFLANNPGMVFSREHLLQSIWGYDFLGDTRAVDSHIKRIRAKLDNTGLNWSIKTIYGVGYKFEVE